MNDKISYCINCMSEIPFGGTFCGQCGHKVGDYVRNQRALRPLTVLKDKYLIGKVLGEGGFGITYLGKDLTLDLKVAIKEFFPSQLSTRNVYEGVSNDLVVIGGESSRIFKSKLDKFVAEGQRLAKLETLPGIVRVLNFFYENNTAYIVMEFVPGQNLKEYSRNSVSKLNWKETLDIMQPVIKSLSYLHEKDIIHRDISPDNIMITEDKNLVLIDFGTAVEIEDNDKSKEIELKRGFAPPEQYSSHGNQGPWTDVYEVCATLYYMISGKTLPDALALLQNKEKIIPLKKFDDTIPAQIEATIMQGLNIDINHRTKGMNDLYDGLYNGRRIIPYKKIFVSVSIAFAGMVAILLLTIIGIFSFVLIKEMNAKNDITNNTIEFTNTSNQATNENKEPASAEKGTTNENFEAPKEKDTASNYVKKNNLSYTDNNFLVYSESVDSIVITDMDNSLTEVVIPDTINDKPVVSINGINKNVTSLVLPDSLKTIGADAFRNCVYLEKIYIPASVSEIGNRAFDNCISLDDIYISEDNTSFYVKDGKIMDMNGNTYN